ncbi:hypothetical protein F2Q70_00026554 [Brassica cretica]|uniref:Uncharacterized protein n=1 Tax=Brassica cretica TaxID=69181 RepID=A0A8S9LFB2_BRACR|nr:hypothetical protein F2Q70_00026554 [Brassica cretica]
MDEGLRKDRYEKRQVKPREPDRSHKVTSLMGEDGQHHGGEDDQHHGHLARGRGRPAPRSPRPWARTTSTTVTSPIGEDDLRLVHLAIGRGQSNPGQSDSFRLSCPPYSCDIQLLDHIPLVSSLSELLSKFYD